VSESLEMPESSRHGHSIFRWFVCSRGYIYFEWIPFLRFLKCNMCGSVLTYWARGDMTCHVCVYVHVLCLWFSPVAIIITSFPMAVSHRLSGCSSLQSPDPFFQLIFLSYLSCSFISVFIFFFNTFEIHT